MRIDAGERQYELVPDWGQLPDGWQWGQVNAVCVDAEDNVHIYARNVHPYMVFDKSGKLVDSWGKGLFDDAHGLHITPDGTMFFVEANAHIVHKFTRQGKHCLTLGKRGQPSDTGWTTDVTYRNPRQPEGPMRAEGGLFGDTWKSRNGVGHPGPPFHRPSDISVTPTGEMFISDGYRNCRVHKYSSAGELIKSWGEVGHADELKDTKKNPGHFHTVHGIWTHDDKVYVVDRENNRIQIFTPEGDYLDMWMGFMRPTKVFISPHENVAYVAEIEDRVSVLDLEGNVIARFGSERSREPGKFWGPHGISADSEGSIFVGEVLEGQRLQKFVRVR
jgi:hypothetical protein